MHQTATQTATLHLLCGKIASGKSTLSLTNSLISSPAILSRRPKMKGSSWWFTAE